MLTCSISQSSAGERLQKPSASLQWSMFTYNTINGVGLYTEKKFKKKKKLFIVLQGDQCSTSLWRSMAAEPTRHLPKPFDLRVNHADIGLLRCFVPLVHLSK